MKFHNFEVEVEVGECENGEMQLAGVELDELVERFGLWIRIVEHPQEVLEEDDLAANDDGAVVAGAGALDQGLEEGMAEHVRGDEVAAARLADVDGVEPGGDLVGAVEGGGGGGAPVGVVPGVVGLAGAGGAARAGAVDDVVRLGGVPALDHALELP